MSERRGTIARAVRLLDQAGVEFDDITIRSPTLDDVFMTLTGRPPEPEAARTGPRARPTGSRRRSRDERARATRVADTFVLAERSVKRIARQPDLWTSFTIQPVMFVLLFAYVFGGAIAVPAEFGDYKDFLIPGIIVQAMSFGGFVTALSIAEDMQKGLIDRFRSLPMARIAVLSGRTIADIATNAVQLAVMIGVGLLIGFAFNASALDVVGGLALCLLIGYAFSWVFAYIGLSVSSPEAANAFGFILIFPLTFISSAFVPPETLPEPLKTFATDINPFSYMVDAVRALFLGTPAGNDVWVTRGLVRGPDRRLRRARRREVPQVRRHLGLKSAHTRRASTVPPLGPWLRAAVLIDRVSTAADGGNQGDTTCDSHTC